MLRRSFLSLIPSFSIAGIFARFTPVQVDGNTKELPVIEYNDDGIISNIDELLKHSFIIDTVEKDKEIRKLLGMTEYNDFGSCDLYPSCPELSYEDYVNLQLATKVHKVHNIIAYTNIPTYFSGHSFYGEVLLSIIREKLYFTYSICYTINSKNLKIAKNEYQSIL